MPETAAKAEPPAPVGVGGRLPRYDRLFAVLLVVITILAYLPVWQAGFIWDDDTLLLDNSAIKTAGGLAQLWARDFPLATTSLWVEWRLWGANPLGYHVANVLLHALSTVLLWRVLRRLSIPGAGLAAAIFAVHPVNAESVAWISERKNTLCMVFYLLSLLLYLRSDREEPERVSRRPLLAYWLSVAMFELALLSKTAVAPLPVVLLVLAWWQQGRLRLKDLWRAAPFFALGAAAGLMSVWFQTHQAIGASMLDVRADSFWARLAGAGWAIWFYLYKALLPLGLSFIYPRWQIDPTHALSYLPTLLVLVTLLIFWCYRRTWGKALLLSFAYFVLMLLPILGFVSIYFMRYSLVADHWQYFAVIGPIAMVSALLTLGVRKVAASPAWLGPVAGGALVLALGLLTWREALTYRSLKTLWTATVARNPTAGIAHNNLGTILLAEGKVDEAIAHFQRAVALQPNAADAYSNLGGALLEKGRVEEAVLQLRKAVQIQPDAANAQINLGNALARQGQFDEAVAHLREALRLHPEHPGPHYNLGNILLVAVGPRTPEIYAKCSITRRST